MKYSYAKIMAVAALSVAAVVFSSAAVMAKTAGIAIVVPAKADVAEAKAAKEMAVYFGKMTDGTIAVSGESEKAPEGKIIYIGQTEFGVKIIKKEELAAYGDEGFIIRSSGGNLAIRGGAPEGTLNGVYYYLEEVLGVRWYAPDAEYVPKKHLVDFEGLDKGSRPAFEYRESFFAKVLNPDWGAKNRLNGSSYGFRPEDGGSKIKYIGFVHTLFNLLSPEKYFDEHPEYFAEVAGKRERDGQLCLTNPDVLNIVKNRVVELAESSGGNKVIISVSQMDNMKHCGCPKCLAVDKEEESPAGTMLRFVNAVADAVAEKYPNVAIDTLAYQYTENAPIITKPRPNVIVRLCHIAPSCDLHPLGKCFWNDRFMQNLKSWAKLTDRLYIWDYHTNFWNYPQPFPILNMIKKDISIFHHNSVKGYFAQGSYQGPGGDLEDLKAWVIAKLLWDPDRDAGALIDDFVKGYYGPAAPAVDKYLAAQHKKAAGKNVHAHLYSESAAYLDAPLLLEMNKALKDAEALAPAGSEHAERVGALRMGYMFVQLTSPELFAPGEAPATRAEFDALMKKYEEGLSHYKITRIHELETVEQTLAKMKSRLMPE